MTVWGLRGKRDEDIWTYARDAGFDIVSKDDDFRALALVRGAPPKVVWLQVGNASTTDIANILISSAVDLDYFSQLDDQALLVLQG